MNTCTLELPFGFRSLFVGKVIMKNIWFTSSLVVIWLFRVHIFVHDSPEGILQSLTTHSLIHRRMPEQRLIFAQENEVVCAWTIDGNPALTLSCSYDALIP